MALAIFDLDETLISGDSDYLWGEFVVEKGIVDETTYRQKNRAFYEQYKRGDLDINAYLLFSCSVLAKNDPGRLLELREEFIEQEIKPLMLPRGESVINCHRDSGDELLIITSTIEFITRPIVDLLGIENLIAPVPEQKDGYYTGKIEGIPSFGKGKVERLEQWLKDGPLSLETSYFYSDSINDLPLLELVGHPVVVDPDELLEREAKNRGWKITSFRD